MSESALPWDWMRRGIAATGTVWKTGKLRFEENLKFVLINGQKLNEKND